MIYNYVCYHIFRFNETKISSRLNLLDTIIHSKVSTGVFIYVGWLRLVGSLKYRSLLQKSPTKETYSEFTTCNNTLESQPWSLDICGVATISRLLKNIGLLCKRSPQKRPILCKKTYIFKEPTKRCHAIQNWGSFCQRDSTSRCHSI